MPNKEPLFRFVLNHSQEMIIRYDGYGYINYVNQKAIDSLGYTSDALHRRASEECILHSR